MSSLVGGVDVTSEYLAKELEAAETAFLEVEEKQAKVAQLEKFGYDSDDDDDDEGGDRQRRQQRDTEPRPLRLLRLKKTADALTLAQKITEWLERGGSALSTKTMSSDNDSLLQEDTRLCLELGDILLQHSDNLFEICPSSFLVETYFPLYEYVHGSLSNLLRQTFKAVRYPKNCSKLQRNVKFQTICTNLRQLEHGNAQLMETLRQQGDDASSTTSMVILEFFTPLVKRIQFHFVERSEDRVTSCRIDRLPEWIFGYFREHVFVKGGPVALVKSLRDPYLLVEFFNELARLFYWVLVERNFFRDPRIAGPRSNPLLLYAAIEQLLLFDRTVQECLPSSFKMPSSSSPSEQPLITMMDLVVANDEDLISWWTDRERESVFSTLFEDESSVNVPKPLANHVSPRAEIFCALIRSVQWKASILSSPGPYMRNVAVPLCSQFVEALQETCTDLRNLLCKNVRQGVPPETQLIANINEWIEIINGTRLAAQVLLREGAWQDGETPAASQSDHDLAHFGRSLERLYAVMAEEFALSFVETILMERAKLASYMMLASHLLSSEQWEGEDTDLSPELRETKVVLYQFHQVCNSILLVEDDTAMTSDDHKIANFAPLAIQTHVMNRLATKFLEVALDMDNVSPEIWQAGAKVFTRDVKVIMGPSDLPLVQRLIEVTKLLSLDSKSIQSLFQALAGLVGADVFLDIHEFSSDGTIYEEATSMIKAKGFTFVELEDVISVLNRRRD